MEEPMGEDEATVSGFLARAGRLCTGDFGTRAHQLRWRNSDGHINRVLTIAGFDRPGVPRLSPDPRCSNRLVRNRMPGGVAGERLTMPAPMPMDVCIVSGESLQG
jgi:hypothetical protein